MDMQVRWLNNDEQELWRCYLDTYRRLLGTLDEELRSTTPLSFGEYEVLVHLSEAPEGRLRMSQLARAVIVSRSGLTRRIDQMIRVGLICKDACEEDRRGTYAEITTQGREALAEAAPIHVQGVRRHFLDHLAPSEVRRMLKSMERMERSLKE